jgi:hypothetical protein
MRTLFLLGAGVHLLLALVNAVAGESVVAAIQSATGWFCLWASSRDYAKPAQ